MSEGVVTLDAERAARFTRRLSVALSASRANASFPDARTAAAHLRHAEGPLVVGAATGLPTYESWARLRADWQVARESGTSAKARSLRELAAPRLGDLDVALRSSDRSARRLHVTLDKVSADGRWLRLLADITVDKGLKDSSLFDLLFPAAELPAELLLVRVGAARGVRAVERVGVGAIDLFADVERAPGPAVDPPALALDAAGAVALSLATSVCASDLTPGDNDLLRNAPSADADAVRARLGSTALPQRLYRDRKLVVNDVAASLLSARARERGTRTVFYRMEAP